MEGTRVHRPLPLHPLRQEPEQSPAQGADSAGTPLFIYPHLPLPSKGERPGTSTANRNLLQNPAKPRPPSTHHSHPGSLSPPGTAGIPAQGGSLQLAPSAQRGWGGSRGAPRSRHGHRAPGPGISQPGNRPPRQEREASQTAGEDEISPRAASGAACKKASCTMAVTRGGSLLNAHTSWGTAGDHAALPHHHHHQRRGHHTMPRTSVCDPWQR